MANRKNNSPMQISFWLTKINPKTNKLYTEDEAIYHIKTFRKTNIEYWLSRGYSEKDAQENIKNFQKNAGKRGVEERKKHPEYDTVHIEYWLKKGYSLDDAKKQLSNRQTTFSKKICIKKYGKTKGEQIFKQRQQIWQTSLQSKSKNEIKKINKNKNTFKYFYDSTIPRDADYWKKWKNICDIRNMKYIDNVEQCKTYICMLYESASHIIGKGVNYFVNNCCPKYLYKTLKISKKTIKQWLNDNKHNETNQIYQIKTSKFQTYHMLLDDGSILRSKLEIQFFIKLLYYGLSVESTNKNYENSKFYYDFKVNGKIIEIAGMMSNENYRNKMIYKQKTFKPFILISETEFDDFIQKVLIENNEKTINYYITRPL